MLVWPAQDVARLDVAVGVPSAVELAESPDGVAHRLHCHRGSRSLPWRD